MKQSPLPLDLQGRGAAAAARQELLLRAAASASAVHRRPHRLAVLGLRQALVALLVLEVVAE